MSASEQESTNPLLQRAREALSRDPAWAGREGEPPPRPAEGAPEQPQAGVSGQLARSVEDATSKIKEIIDAAEKVAAEIDAEARAEADRYLERRQREADRTALELTDELERLTEPVLTRLGALRDETQALQRAVDDAAAAVRSLAERAKTTVREEAAAATPTPKGPVPPPEAEEEPPAFRQRGGRPVAYPGTGGGAPSAEGETAAGDAHAEAVLRATQMAVAGHERDEIEATLVREYAIADAGSIVSQLLGDPE